MKIVFRFIDLVFKIIYGERLRRCFTQEFIEIEFFRPLPVNRFRFQIQDLEVVLLEQAVSSRIR